MAETEEAAKLAVVRDMYFDHPGDLHWNAEITCESLPADQEMRLLGTAKLPGLAGG